MGSDEDRKEAAMAVESAWPAPWRQAMAEPGWRARLASSIERRDLEALKELAECWIGLECHARLDTGRKLFCAVPEGFAGWVDIGLPGALPSLDPLAARLATDLGAALGARMGERFGFERKRYAYPDLAKGYQTTQKALSVWFGGKVEWDGGSLGLERAQIEEDAAKVKRVEGGFEMDFARAGSPLLEIVSVAAPLWPDGAREAAKALWREAVHSGATQGRIEEGHFKSDVNVSLRPKGAQGLGERVEVKGVGSFDFARAAAEDVVWTLAAELLGPGPLPKRTLGFDEAAGACAPMREKGSDAAYKFLPEGDLALRRKLAPGPARLGWMAARAALRSAFGAERDTDALWDDPRRSRAAAMLGAELLGELARAWPAGEGGALARGFFAKAERSAVEGSPEQAALALGWACRQALAGSRKGRAVEAALGAWREAFDPRAAARALDFGADSAAGFAAALAEALAGDPKAAAAMEQARGGKPKALGYLFGALSARLRSDGERFDPMDLSAWLAESAKKKEAP